MTFSNDCTNYIMFTVTRDKVIDTIYCELRNDGKIVGSISEKNAFLNRMDEFAFLDKKENAKNYIKIIKERNYGL